MRRELGSFETAATLSNDHAPFVVVVVLQLDGGPSPDRLRAALDELQRRHPPLRVRITERSGRFRFEPAGVPPIPLRTVDRVGDEDWRQAAEAELNERIDAGSGPLLRCAYLKSDRAGNPTRGPSEILITFHHAIMDAASGTSLLAELLGLCRSGIRQDPESPEAPTLPPVEALFPPAYRGLRGRARALGFLVRQLGDEVSYRIHSRGTRKPPVAERFRCRVLPVGLSASETSELVSRTRRRRITVAGALSAAFLLAVHEHLYDGGRTSERPLPMRYMTFADLRPYLRPPVSADALGSLISMLRFTTRVDRGQPFWPLARRITDQVAAGFRRGDKYCALLLAETMMRQVTSQRSERMAATAISYGGAFRSERIFASTGTSGEPREAGGGARSERDPEPFAVRGLHAFVSNFEVGPEYTAQARIVGGALQLDVVYLDSDMDGALARALADEILDVLRAAVRSDAPGG